MRTSRYLVNVELMVEMYLEVGDGSPVNYMWRKRYISH